MNHIKLLSEWPGWAAKTADDILASPAWAMRTRWGDEEAVLRMTPDRPRDMVALRVSFDGREHFLGLGRRDSFADIDKLWDRRKELPAPLILALVEKECGRLFQLLENCARRQLEIISLTDAAGRADAGGFEVVAADGTVLASFALELTGSIRESFGHLSAIDTSDPSIRAMTRPATVEYASFSMADKTSSIEPGDMILAPELEDTVAAVWCVEPPRDDGKWHIRSAASEQVSFASFADGTMPAVPAPGSLELFYGAKLVASGRFARLGLKTAFSVEEVL